MTTTATANLFTDRGIRKATALVEAGGVIPSNRPNVFFVKGTADYYRVITDELGDKVVLATCNCPHGANRRTTTSPHCYHATAVLMTVLRARNAQDPDSQPAALSTVKEA